MILKRKITVFILFILLLVSFNFAQKNENTWKRYPAISPDGTKIVFSYQGDLFIVPSSGGKAIQLTRHKAYDFHPIWSPDGKYIAFASDRYGNFDVFLIPAEGGKPKRLTYHSRPDIPTDFTPDGKKILFYSRRMKAVKSSIFPVRVFPELYEVSIKGGIPSMYLTTAAIEAKFNKTGDKIIYYDKKGFESKWRKHHTSSVTRDIWIYSSKTGNFKKITDFKGEDRDPVWAPDENYFYYLTEKSGSFNVWKKSLVNPNNEKQITFFSKDPVRFLSISKNGDLCFGFNGDIYVLKKGEKKPQKVNIELDVDYAFNNEKVMTRASGVTEFALSPNGKEVAFIIRGDIFVSSVDFSDTKRITNTPEQERSVSFSPDGRKLIFAGERDNSWNIYEATIVRKGEPYFYASTLIDIKPLVKTKAETFQPKYSPDGKKIAFLENRETLKVMDLKTKKIITVLPGNKNYSYSDGDQWYDWSPDSNWLLVQFLDRGTWVSEVGLVKADGSQPVINLTNSGYNDAMPKWGMKGKMMIWATDRNGMRSHGSWGSEYDIYAMFFDPQAYDRFLLSKSDYELLKEREKKAKKGEKGKIKKNKKDKTSEEKPLKIVLKNLEDRTVRLTLRSSNIFDAALSPNGETLVYISTYQKGYALWSNKIREKKIKLITKLSSPAGQIVFDKKGKNVFILASGRIMKVDVGSGRIKPISFRAELDLKYLQEKEYIFEHIWRQVKEKIYDPKMQGVDWSYYKKNYKRFLPSINNNWDYSELLSEMLGELNVSHTGCRYYPRYQNPDSTAALGAFLEQNIKHDGLKVLEVIEKGPMDKADSKITKGTIIEKIDGVFIKKGMNYYPLLNHKRGKKVLLSLYNPKTKTRWEEVIRPISWGAQEQLLYKRWVKTREQETDRLSHGRLGYVHIRAMNSASFREIYSKIMGKFYNREGIILDTRFNGGGWLHDDLVTFLSGKKYLTLYPRGRKIGIEPMGRWTKKSIVIMNESNYSDAFMFPFAYKELNIGKLVGMPVPGTGTAVWWERLQDPTLVFGIPQVGVLDLRGKYLENQQLYPDYTVNNDPASLIKGEDKQLEKAVEVLLSEK